MKGFSEYGRMAFSFLAYLFSFWRYSGFFVMQHNTQLRNITAVFFKLGTSNVHHKRNRMTPNTLLPWQHSRLQSPSVKNQISPFATFQSGPEVLARSTNGCHIILTLPIRLVGVDDPCLRENLGILGMIKTEPVAWLLSWQQCNGCHYVCFVMYIAVRYILELFSIECCAVLVEPPMMPSLSSFTYYKNVNISKTKWFFPKRKMPFFFTLKSLSNKRQLFFTS